MVSTGNSNNNNGLQRCYSWKDDDLRNKNGQRISTLSTNLSENH